jgi:EAL domain-containing protein (putative c-di-GMP-specific phosphodiesterase class I)
MIIQANHRATGCAECARGAGLDFELAMAFQPIVKFSSREIFAHEALVRGRNNEPASSVFSRINDQNRYRFDQACRVTAIALATELGMSSHLSINFMPHAIYRPELCIRTTLEASRKFGFPLNRIIFEITESEKVEDHQLLRDIVECYQHHGFKTAIDDFGAGYAGLNLLAEFQTDLIKLDMALIRGINRDKSRQAIVKGIVQVCRDLSIEVIAEGIETHDEMSALVALGIDLFQGYLFAGPSFQSLSTVSPDAYRMRRS